MSPKATAGKGGAAPAGSASGGPWSQWFQGFAGLAQGPAAQVYKEWEGWLSQQMEKLSQSDTFLSHMAKGLEGSFQMKSWLDRTLEASLKAMRLPGASEVEAIHQRLDALERRLDRIAEQLQALAEARGDRREPGQP